MAATRPAGRALKSAVLVLLCAELTASASQATCAILTNRLTPSQCQIAVGIGCDRAGIANACAFSCAGCDGALARPPSPPANEACIGLTDRLTVDQCVLAVNIGCDTPGIRDACPFSCAGCGSDVATTVAPIAPNTLTLASDVASVVYKGDFKHGLMTFSVSWNAAEVVGPVDMIPVVRDLNGRTGGTVDVAKTRQINTMQGLPSTGRGAFTIRFLSAMGTGGYTLELYATPAGRGWGNRVSFSTGRHSFHLLNEYVRFSSANQADLAVTKVPGRAPQVSVQVDYLSSEPVKFALQLRCFPDDSGRGRRDIASGESPPTCEERALADPDFGDRGPANCATLAPLCASPTPYIMGIVATQCAATCAGCTPGTWSFSPTFAPTTSDPTTAPSLSPTVAEPTLSPTVSPTSSDPTSSPSVSPTSSDPTTSPSISPTSSDPTVTPSVSPTTSDPTVSPSVSPTSSTPTLAPTVSPTISEPTAAPSVSPTTSSPTSSPSISPATSDPTSSPSTSPTVAVPTMSPSMSPTSSDPTTSPTASPTTAHPTRSPTADPTVRPTTMDPTRSPTTMRPTASPVVVCPWSGVIELQSCPEFSQRQLCAQETIREWCPVTCGVCSPTAAPTLAPSTATPTIAPSISPTSCAARLADSVSPGGAPFVDELSRVTCHEIFRERLCGTLVGSRCAVSCCGYTHSPTMAPSSSAPTVAPTTAEPTVAPTTAEPTANPTAVPTSEPTVTPTTSQPTMPPVTTGPTASPTTPEPTPAPTTSAPTTAAPITSGPTTAMPSISPSAAPTPAPVNCFLAIRDPHFQDELSAADCLVFAVTPGLCGNDKFQGMCNVTCSGCVLPPSPNPTGGPTHRPTAWPTTLAPTATPTTRAPTPSRAPTRAPKCHGGPVYVSATTPELDDTITSGLPSRIRTATITGSLKSYIPVDVNFTLEVSMGRYSPQVQDDGTVRNRWIETRDRTRRITFSVAYADGPGAASGDHLLNGAPATGEVTKGDGVGGAGNTETGVSASFSNSGFAVLGACALILILGVAAAWRFRSSAPTTPRQPAHVVGPSSGGNIRSPNAPRAAFVELEDLHSASNPANAFEF